MNTLFEQSSREYLEILMKVRELRARSKDTVLESYCIMQGRVFITPQEAM